MAAFLPKYFESQFHLSPGDAAILVGIIVVPAGAGGTLCGGYVAKRLKLNRAGSIKMYIVCQAIILPLYLGFLLYCPNGSVAGIHTLDKGPFDLSSCNQNCHCDISNYDPVCSLSDDVTFYNPCFAGCTQSLNGSLFGDCSCFPSISTGGLGKKGFCDSAKCDYTYFAIVIFLQIFFTFAATMPGLVASLR